MTHSVRNFLLFFCVVIAGGCGRRPGVGIWDPDGSVVEADGSGDGTVVPPVGFVVAWWEEGSVYLQIFDCCIRRL